MNVFKGQSGSCMAFGSEISLKYFHLCFEDEQKSYGFRMK